MRCLALLGLCLALSGCGFYTWRQAPFVAGQNPYLPEGNSENMRRAMGLPVSAQPLESQPGNVWPGPIAAEPTLEQLEQQGGALPNAVPPPALPPARGSPVPPASPVPVPVPRIPPVPPAVAPAPPVAVAPPVMQTPSGTGNLSGGTSAYKTITMPNGTTAIVVPNGNGTSTVIYSSGKVETIPTPK